MTRLLDVCGTAAGAFVGTNIDDFVVLLLLILGIPQGGNRTWQIVAGQYVGFCVLIVVSVLGAAALHNVSEEWVGLLGVIPLALGLRGIVLAMLRPATQQEKPILAGSLATVAIVTIGNGGDNVSVYVLLFRELSPVNIAVTAFVFLLMLGGLCAVAMIIGRKAKTLLRAIRSTQWVTPIVFIIIGTLLLIRTGAITRIAG